MEPPFYQLQFDTTKSQVALKKFKNFVSNLIPCEGMRDIYVILTVNILTI